MTRTPRLIALSIILARGSRFYARRLISFPVSHAFCNQPKPQKSRAYERQREQEQIPASKSWRRRFHLGSRFPLTGGRVQDYAHPPHFILIKLRLALEFHLPTLFFPPSPRNRLWQTPAHRSDAHLNAQIRRHRSTWRRIDHHPTRSRAQVGMRPQRNHARPDALIRNDWKRRPIVR
jgi:hypothetical protein